MRNMNLPEHTYGLLVLAALRQSTLMPNDHVIDLWEKLDGSHDESRSARHATHSALDMWLMQGCYALVLGIEHLGHAIVAIIQPMGRTLTSLGEALREVGSSKHS